jgi:hypothetical protein
MTLLVALLMCPGVLGQKHEHGKAELDASVEGATFTAEFRAPADAIFGFERTPRSDKERKAVAEAIERLKAKAAELIVLPPEAGCRFAPAKASVHSESNGHQDVEVAYQAQCARPLTAGEIRFAFGRLFPGIRELAVQLVAPNHQTAKTLMNGLGAIRIAP